MPTIAVSVASLWAPGSVITVSVLAAVAAGLYAVAAYRRIARTIVDPLGELQLAADRLRIGDLDHRIRSPRTDELGALADAFDEMASGLQDSTEQLAHRALHDPLTGLANRVLLHDRVSHALTQANRHSEAIAVLLIDLDDFKMVNDSLGHAVGDHLLIAAADRVTACLRLGDTGARLGGDEFAILLESVGDARMVQEVAGRVNSALTVPFGVTGSDVHVSASIGIALSSPVGGITADDLLRNAELAMYTAKRRGKGGHELFESPMHTAAVQRLNLGGELRQALTNDELVLHYQPTIDLTSGDVLGCEALVRWMHPARGLLSPMDFVPIAEETGLIVPLGWWVLKTACHQLAAWHRRFPQHPGLTVNVNLSARQLQHPDLLAQVAGALQRSGLPPSALTLEITETVMMQDGDLALDRLTRLRESGVRIAIDDFGTGYSSLRYLQRFPIDVLKVDKSFVDGIDATGASALVEAIIGLANRLELVSVAEGIERREQVVPLRQLGCTVGQGHLFARAGEPLTIDRMLLA
ncbi:MAG: EAL domain-containing protein, partial [Acidimicrobiales bacterium]